MHAVEFIVERVETFEWNDEAFEQLVIPPKHKQVLRTLVESHNAGSAKKFDDFVSALFEIETGIDQGCPLSVILYTREGKQLSGPWTMSPLSSPEHPLKMYMTRCVT